MIAAQQPAVAAVTETELPRIEDVSALVPPDSAIVEFFLGPGNYVTAFVIKQKGIAAMNTLDLGKFDLPGTVEQFRAEVQYGVAGEPTGEPLDPLPACLECDRTRRTIVRRSPSVTALCTFRSPMAKNTGEGPSIYTSANASR